MFKKFFQGQDDDDTPSSQDAKPDIPDISPSELWHQVGGLPVSSVSPAHKKKSGRQAFSVD
jgi:hypothetical protein